MTPAVAFSTALLAALAPSTLSHADALRTSIATVCALLVVLAYVLEGLPRLRAIPAVAVSAALCASMAVVAGLLARHGIWLPWAVPVVGIVCGHVGWSRARLTGHTAALAHTPDPENAVEGAAPGRQTLGRYVLEKEVGRGAMGAVYLGRDTKIGRPVAIKTLALSKEFAGDDLAEARKRFFREAETAGRLQHPDIVTIFDAGEDKELAFIAMELLKGENLQTCTQPGHLLPAATVLEVVARVADALAYAHSQGVVHRDVKPANVMIDLAAGTVKVTDFGIARITDSSRTRTGMVLGTPSFMSPEQLAGRRVDGRSDLYSLGVMLFQLLTGKLPYRSDSMATLMHMIANEPAPDVRSLRPDLPEVVALVVAHALEKRPEARYGGGQLLASDLRALVPRLTGAKSAPPPMPGTNAPTTPGGFEATMKIDRTDPGHNSGF